MLLLGIKFMAEQPKKLGNVGGPLLGAGHKIISKAMERPTQASANAARDVGERVQGRAAHEAGRRRGFGSLLLQLAGGRTRPTQRARAQMIQRGQEWNTNENALAAGQARSEYDSAFREGGV